jgi:hypothetical protein
MKKVCLATFAVLVCCVHAQQAPQLTAQQAKTIALQLSNDKAFALFNRRPFRDGQPVTFVAGHWVWRGLAGVGCYDLEAAVDLAANGSTNQVHLIPWYNMGTLSLLPNGRNGKIFPMGLPIGKF